MLQGRLLAAADFIFKNRLFQLGKIVKALLTALGAELLFIAALIKQV